MVRDVSNIASGTMPGQFDRYNMRRQVTITANICDQDLGSVAEDVQAAIARAGEPPQGAKIEIRGQIVPMNEMTSGLSVGLVFTALVLTAVWWKQTGRLLES